MRLHFREVADVADVVAGPVLIQIFKVHLLSAQGSRPLEGFEDGDAVRSSAADVVNLAAARFLNKA